MRLNGSIEDNVLTLLCHSTEHAAALSVQLNPDIFSTRNYRKIAEKAFAHILDYSAPIGVHLRDEMEADLRRGDEGKLLGRVIDDMDALRIDIQPDYVLASLAKFIASRKLAMALEEASDSLHAGDLEGAERAIYQRDIPQASSPGIWLHDAKAMLAFMDKSEGDYFPSGIEVFDQRGVRPQRGEQFLIIGPKKAGKSFWAVQIGKEAILARKKVLHISTENSEMITARRYCQALFAMTAMKAETIRVPILKKDSLGRFTNLDFDTRSVEGLIPENRASVAKKLNAFRSRSKLLIKEFPTGSLTIPQLNAYLDHLSRADNFRPDLLIVDSGNRMAMRGDKIRTDMGQTFIQLRGIAQARNMAQVVTTHSNRSGDSAKIVTGGAHVGEDYSLTGTADIICTISRTATEKSHGLARILVDGARNIEDSWIALITQNYATAQFCIDSVYMQRHVQSEINRLSGEREEDAE